eukprot:INCI9988.2.p1 GENE.INCI9988.2~~INCI9988.2.p1  ORF type:complete len:586 (+),score=111.18 INCI9988.2:184-1941(+)
MEPLGSGRAEQLQQQTSPLDTRLLEDNARVQPSGSSSSSSSSNPPQRRSDKEIYGMNMAGKGWYKLAKLEEERERREEEALANKCPVTIIKRSWSSVRSKFSWRRSPTGALHEEKQGHAQAMYGPVEKPVPPPSFRGGVFQLHGRARGDSLSSSSEYDDDSSSSCGSPRSVPEVPAMPDSDNSVAETQPSSSADSPFRQAVSSAATRLNPNPTGAGGPATLERWNVGFGPLNAGGEDEEARHPDEEVHDFQHRRPIQHWAQLRGHPHALHHAPFGHDDNDGPMFPDGAVGVAAGVDDAEPAHLVNDDLGHPATNDHFRAFAGANAEMGIPFEIHELGPRQRRQRAALQFGTDATTPWLWYARMLTPLTLLSAPWRTLLGLSSDDQPEFDSDDDAEEEAEHEEDEDELDEDMSNQNVTQNHVPSPISRESTEAHAAPDSEPSVPDQPPSRKREVTRCPICQRRLHYRQKQRRRIMNVSGSASGASDHAVCENDGCVEDDSGDGAAPVSDSSQPAISEAGPADEERQAQKEARRRKRRQVLQLACGHSFHRHCIWKWIVKLQGRTCPICRDEVDWPSEVTASVVHSL